MLERQGRTDVSRTAAGLYRRLVPVNRTTICGTGHAASRAERGLSFMTVGLLLHARGSSHHRSFSRRTRGRQVASAIHLLTASRRRV